MKIVRLPDAGVKCPQEITWTSLEIDQKWINLIAKLAPGTSPSEIQKICLRDKRLLESRRNLLVSAPTNSGKSLIGYLFLLDSIRRAKRAVLLEPLRALAQEKYEELCDHRQLIGDFLGRKFTPKITTGDYSLDEETLSSPPPEDGEIIVATPERIEVILRNPKFDGWIDSIGSLCVDEAHQISCPRRGGSLEFVIASLLGRKSSPRLLLLSASLGSTESAEKWLDPCDLAKSDLRWPPLKKEILVLEEDDTADAVVSASAREILHKEGSSLMVFVYRKADAVKLAKILESELGVPVLAYHSNMPLSKKEEIRKKYLSKSCRCLVSTTALGTGINLPASHLIIRDTTFFPDGKIPSSQLLQMMGRAGRGNQEGSAMVLLRPKDGWDPTSLEKALIEAPLPELRSGLLYSDNFESTKAIGDAESLEPAARLVLSLLSRSGSDGISLTKLDKFTASMLAGEQLKSVLADSVSWLTNQSNRLAYLKEADGSLCSTRLGSSSSISGLPPGISAAVGRLMRDLFSIDTDLLLVSQLSMLDLLLLAELLSQRTFLGGHFSKELGVQVDDWMERAHAKSVLFNEWIRPRGSSSRADELIGSLGIFGDKSTSELIRNKCYLRMRSASVLWMRGQGQTWSDISRRWGLDGGAVAEEEWIRNRSWLISGFSGIFDIRCFFFHLREECGASDEHIGKAKNVLRRLKAECFQILGRLKYCSPLGPLLTRMKSTGTKGIGCATILKLENAGLTTPQAILELTEEQSKKLKLDPKRMTVIRNYLRRR